MLRPRPRPDPNGVGTCPGRQAGQTEPARRDPGDPAPVPGPKQAFQSGAQNSAGGREFSKRARPSGVGHALLGWGRKRPEDRRTNPIIKD
ncbi:hypothetical protein CROQUDRAFT_99105 [Cronartium quercuum f. sp. fusiforme G11]|uniref:Uncharacterized protein n=1 Tax=Cronartium quercuum f. sp. fusiforme G11 TaxID=708437 RepID=A0A9P6NCB4_9BASI|nr:hypothetical protein CROQUDRAFT_99105 [Cronartium quercuum f. sp. fusiforme G11]